MSIKKEWFGRLDDGAEVYAYTLEGKNGLRARILNYGCTVTNLWVPDKNGVVADVISGFDTLDFYHRAFGHHGAVVGRFTNRIANGRFTLDGQEYVLAQNNGANHLHGGNRSFGHYVWDATEQDGDEPALVLHRVSPDGEEGYPGNLDVTVTYRVTKENGLSIHYVATTDRATIINLTNHCYFNLGGYTSGSVLSHELMLDADAYVPLSDKWIPTGEIRSVEGTPFDFRSAKTIERDMGAQDPDLLRSKGYDQCLVFTDRAADGPLRRGELYDPESGRGMALYTDRPCVFIYTANGMADKVFDFKGGCAQAPKTFICLEAQSMPDSPNHENFTDCTLRPGEVYDTTTEYRFFAK